jgi:hypothetical protein
MCVCIYIYVYCGLQSCKPMYIHTHIHAHIHTYIHTYIQAFIRNQKRTRPENTNTYTHNDTLGEGCGLWPCWHEECVWKRHSAIHGPGKCRSACKHAFKCNYICIYTYILANFIDMHI